MSTIAIPIGIQLSAVRLRAAAIELGSVRSFEPGCVVPDDPGEVVRGARPISSQDRERIREQQISRMMADFHRQKSNVPVLQARST